MRSIFCTWMMLGVTGALLGAEPALQVEKLKTVADGLDLRLAQAGVAHAGTDSLPAMEKLAAQHDAKLDARLMDTVGLMLVVSTPWEDLQKYPNLMALCTVEFDNGRTALKPYVGIKSYDSGEGDPGAGRQQAPKTAPAKQARNNLALKARGFLIPGLIELAKDNSPPARMTAMQMLLSLGAVGQKPTFDRLLQDNATVKIFHGDYTTNDSIGKVLADTLLRQHPFAGTTKDHAAAYEAEQYVTYLDLLARGQQEPYELTNRIRTEAKAYSAATWDEYWKLAAPILKKTWER